jgi:gamma-glutamyltranspeptidase/glutathione hydrolase
MVGMEAERLWQGQVFLLNNEMDDFSVKPGVPNMYGAVGNEEMPLLLIKGC